MPHVIVETAHDPPAGAADLQAMLAKLRMCLLVREVVTHAVYLAQNGRRAVFLLECRDADRARDAFRSAEIPFERAWSADPVTSLP